ncbi:hypothetical protein DSO57_1035513 [Entomophthora muscae]|uniref:Uncharacterized protein n=1 Tax=Entomophthora muscae TaxID=34485 RepID=A0ACC2TY33_9FUNG|nr:hypothetical protein DSO57_1035513 [Entomophthora muscae]
MNPSTLVAIITGFVVTAAPSCQQGPLIRRTSAYSTISALRLKNQSHKDKYSRRRH